MKSLSLLLLLLSLSAVAADDAASRLRKQLQNVASSAHAQEPSEDWKALAPQIDASLTRADNALKANRTYAALEELARAQVNLQAYRQSHRSLSKPDEKQFESAWGKASVQLVAADQQASRRDWSHSAAVARAIAESAQRQSVVLLEASRAYAGATEPQYGLFYLEQSRAYSDFSNFAYSLPLAPRGTPLPLHSYAGPLLHLQDEVNAAFQPPRSIERHSDFIMLNATLKLARELNDNQQYAGAVYKYLAAVQQLGVMTASSADSADVAKLRAGLEEWRAKLNSSGRDDSIAQLYVEKAESLLHDGAAPSDLANAAAIVSRVLPAYENALQAPAQEQPVAAAPITVTLVRWPYT